VCVCVCVCVLRFLSGCVFDVCFIFYSALSVIKIMMIIGHSPRGRPRRRGTTLAGETGVQCGPCRNESKRNNN